MGLDTEIGRHSGQDDLAHTSFSELQREIVRLGAVHLVRARDDRLAVRDQRLVLLEPVGAGALEALEGERSVPAKHVDAVHHRLDGAAELPPLVGRVVVVGRDEDRVAVLLGRLHQGLDVLDRAVGGDALADETPGHALGREKVVLWIDDDDGGRTNPDIHAGIG